LGRHSIPAFERTMERCRLRVADQIGDFADRKRRLDEIAARRFLACRVKQLLERYAFVGETTLERAPRHRQLPREDVDARGFSAEIRGERSLYLLRHT